MKIFKGLEYERCLINANGIKKKKKPTVAGVKENLGDSPVRDTRERAAKET